MKKIGYILFLVTALGITGLHAAGTDENSDNAAKKAFSKITNLKDLQVEESKLDPTQDWSTHIDTLAKNIAYFAQAPKDDYVNAQTNDEEKKTAKTTYEAKKTALKTAKAEYVKAVKELLSKTPEESQDSNKLLFYRSIKNDANKTFTENKEENFAEDVKEALVEEYNKVLTDNAFATEKNENGTKTLEKQTPKINQEKLEDTKQAILQTEARVAIIAEIVGLKRDDISWWGKNNFNFSYQLDDNDKNMSEEFVLLDEILAAQNMFGKIVTNIKNIPAQTTNYIYNNPGKSSLIAGASATAIIGVYLANRYNMLRTAKYKWFGMTLPDNKIDMYAHVLATGNIDEEKLLSMFSKKNVDLIKQRAQVLAAEYNESLTAGYAQ